MTDVDRSRPPPAPELATTTRLVTPAQRAAISPGTITPPWKPSTVPTLSTWSSSQKAGRSSMGASLPPTPSSSLGGHQKPRSAAAPTLSSRSGGHRFGHAAFKGKEPLPPDARVRSVTTHPGQDQVLAEYVVEHEIKVPKRTTREDWIERTYVVPERVLVEEVVEEAARVVERVVEVAQPVVMEKIVEIPEYEYIEKVVEVPHKVVQEKIREVPRIEFQERVIEVPRLVPREKIVNVPVYEYHEFPVEKIVEVAEVREQVLVREKPVPRYVDKPVPQERTVEVENVIARRTPVPVEAVTYLQLQLPKIRPVYQQLEVPVYVPRFIEVPVAAEFCDEEFLDRADRCIQEVSKLVTHRGEAVSMCAMEETAGMVQGYNFEEMLCSQRFAENFAHWWRSNQVTVDEMSLQSICQTIDRDGGMVTEAVSVVRPNSVPTTAGKATSFTTTTACGESNTRLISAATTSQLPPHHGELRHSRPPLESGTVSTETRNSMGSGQDALEYQLHKKVPEARPPEFPTMQRIPTEDLGAPLPLNNPPAFGSTSSVDSEPDEAEAEEGRRGEAEEELPEISALNDGGVPGSAHTTPSTDGRVESSGYCEEAAS